MNIKLKVFLFTVILMLFVFPVGLSSASQIENIATNTNQSDDALRIALVYNTGSALEDGGFNESSWNALLESRLFLGAEIEAFQPADPSDAVSDLEELAEGDWDVIVTVGFALAEVTTQVAADYPDVWFIGVDQFQAEPLPNLVGLIFPEDQAGFLAGVLAASVSETGLVAGIYGTDEAPPVVAFREGYEAGVRWVAQSEGVDVEVVGEYHPGTVFDAFSDPQWGASMAAEYLGTEADVVFAAAGATGNGALEEVAFAADSGDRVFCIGVDIDQWLTIPEAHPCLITSAVKQVQAGVYGLIRQYVDGTIEGGNFLGSVGLADFHDFDEMVDDDLRELLEQIDFGLRSQAVLTCYNRDLTGVRIGMVMDVDQRIDDGSFNESVWNGLRAAEFCGAEIDYVESQDATDYATNIAEFAEEGFDIVVTVGFALAEDTNAAAAAYPDTRFVGVDQFQDMVTEGVTGMVFHEADAGFLAGVLAANLTETNVVAGVYGTDIIPPVVAFKEGFESGVRYANPDVNVISTFHPGGVDTAFSDPQWGATTARQALDQDADVVFALVVLLAMAH